MTTETTTATTLPEIVAFLSEQEIPLKGIISWEDIAKIGANNLEAILTSLLDSEKSALEDISCVTEDLARLEQEKLEKEQEIADLKENLTYIKKALARTREVIPFLQKRKETNTEKPYFASLRPKDHFEGCEKVFLFLNLCREERFDAEFEHRFLRFDDKWVSGILVADKVLTDFPVSLTRSDLAYGRRFFEFVPSSGAVLLPSELDYLFDSAGKDPEFLTLWLSNVDKDDVDRFALMNSIKSPQFEESPVDWKPDKIEPITTTKDALYWLNTDALPSTEQMLSDLCSEVLTYFSAKLWQAHPTAKAYATMRIKAVKAAKKFLLKQMLEKKE